jgi:Protein of unknown function DUF86
MTFWQIWLRQPMPDEVTKSTPEVPWREVKGMRIIAAHAYHRIDYEEVLGHFARRRSANGPSDQALASEPGMIAPNAC